MIEFEGLVLDTIDDLSFEVWDDDYGIDCE